MNNLQLSKCCLCGRTIKHTEMFYITLDKEKICKDCKSTLEMICKAADK